MRIKKKNVTAAEALVEVAETGSCGYDDAIFHIKSAIECLGCIAKTDELAKESIANLSVVLFDLK